MSNSPTVVQSTAGDGSCRMGSEHRIAGCSSRVAVHSQLCACSSTRARIVAGVKPHRTTLPDLLGSYYGPTHSTHPWPGGVCHFNFPPLSSSTRWLQLVVYSFPRHLFVALTPRVAPLQLLAGELCNICERPNLPCFQLGLACSGSGNTLPRLPKH